MGGCGRCTGIGRIWALSRLKSGALVGHHLAGEEPREDLELVLQPVEAARRGRELDPELAVLGVEPGRTEGELEPAPAGVVDGHRLRRRGSRDGGR